VKLRNKRREFGLDLVGAGDEQVRELAGAPLTFDEGEPSALAALLFEAPTLTLRGLALRLSPRCQGLDSGLGDIARPHGLSEIRRVRVEHYRRQVRLCLFQPSIRGHLATSGLGAPTVH
jgi:hypothetical protein